MRKKKSQKNKWWERLEKDDWHGAMRGGIGIKMADMAQWEIRKIDCRESSLSTQTLEFGMVVELDYMFRLFEDGFDTMLKFNGSNSISKDVLWVEDCP